MDEHNRNRVLSPQQTGARRFWYRFIIQQMGLERAFI